MPNSIPNAAQLRNRLRMRQLHLLLALSQHGAIRRAAQELGLSQPAATKMLHEMEEVIGVSLFTRHARGMTPTLFGEALIRYARTVFADLDGVREELVALHSGQLGKVRIGAVMAPAPGLLTRAIVAIKEVHPRLTMTVQVDTSDVLVRALEEDRLDVALGRIPEGWDMPGLQFEVLEDEPLSVIAGVAHPRIKARTLSLRDLADYPWILQPSPSPMRGVLDHAFRDAGLETPANLVETSSILTTTALLQHTHMVAVVPTSVASHYAERDLLGILPVRLPRHLAPYGLITRAGRLHGPATQVFVEMIRRLALPV